LNRYILRIKSALWIRKARRINSIADPKPADVRSHGDDLAGAIGAQDQGEIRRPILTGSHFCVPNTDSCRIYCDQHLTFVDCRHWQLPER
jgi:hypothetical protein